MRNLWKFLSETICDMREIFKEIHDYEGFYEISNCGRVKSLMEWNGHIHRKRETPTYVTPTDNGNGYLIVGLRKFGKRKNFYVHRLVAEHFLEIEKSRTVVNHKDFNRKNNEVSNLEWCTQKENTNYSSVNMRHSRNICTSKTGHKYIYKKKYGYEVDIVKLHVGSFKTIDEAIFARNEALKSIGRTSLWH
nr:MAG TPA: homing endonuclease [Bacteriophage sp.]